MMKKSKFWLLLWATLIGLGSLYSILQSVFNYTQYGEVLIPPPYADYQLFLLLFFLPLFLIPTLFVSLHYAIQENNKKVRIATTILIAQHSICFLAVLLQVL